MNKSVDVFIPYSDSDNFISIIDKLSLNEFTNNIFILSSQHVDINNSKTLIVNNHIHSTETLIQISESLTSEYCVLILSNEFNNFIQSGLQRIISTVDENDQSLVYSDYYLQDGENLNHFKLTDYQSGSIRDNFNFGKILAFSSTKMKQEIQTLSNSNYSGLYSLRLSLSKTTLPIHIQEPLYTSREDDTRKSGEKQFDYVNPAAEEVQKDYERAATEYLKSINALLTKTPKKVLFDKKDFQFEASIIIPVKNRASTIETAINSALNQVTNFDYNIIVVDNYSDDGTTEVVHNIAEHNEKLIHILPDEMGLGIGGCWNEALNHKVCGMFAVQLDSDDLYINENTLQRIVDEFYKTNYPMVIGSYELTDYQLIQIPPGIVDHKEWTEDNGRNNALRINGLGAPRAFYTPLLREIKIPNVSYGEDYYLGLRISREYGIARIYDPLYTCRRWDGNSDSDLDIQKENEHNLYKDKLRTLEISARQKLNNES